MRTKWISRALLVLVIVGLGIGANGCCSICKKRCPPDKLGCPPETKDDWVVKPLPDNPIQVGPGNAGANMTYKESTTMLSSNPYNAMRDDMLRGGETPSALINNQTKDIKAAKFTVKVQTVAGPIDVEVEFEYKPDTKCMAWNEDQVNVQLGACDADTEPCRTNGIPAVIFGELVGNIQVQQLNSATWENADYFTLKPKENILGCN